MLKIKKLIKTNYFTILLVCLLAIGCFLRLYRINQYPVGLNQDEASIAYEAYSIAHYGIDRNGNSFPVHLVAWGSGQNALYAYLIAPLTFFIHDDVLVTRLPMAIVGCITLLVVAIFIKKYYHNKYGLLALFILVVFPWHIMKSRWGLESNLFPDLILWGIIAIYYGLKREKHRYFIISSIIFGLSTYAYGPAYAFVPVLLVLLYGYYIFRRQVKPKWATLYIFLTSLVALPMILFVLINYFDLPGLNLYGLTIPKLDFNRFTDITSVNGDFISNCFQNLFSSIKIIFSQSDDLGLNTIPYFGIFYLFSLPFCIYGLVISAKKLRHDKNLYATNIIWLVASLVVCALVDPNINRINIIWFPLQIFAIIGIVDLAHAKKAFYLSATATYALSAVVFVGYYFTNYQNLIISPNYTSLKQATLHASSIDYDKLYFTDSLNQPYIYYLLISKLPPADYIFSREIPEYHTMFQQVKSIDNVHFYIPKTITPGNAYIVPNSGLTSYEIPASCHVSAYEYYSVVDCSSQP